MAAKPGKSTDILDAVALIVVDMQTTFLDVIEGAPAVIERCGFAIEAARALGLRVVFTEQAPAKLGPTDPRLLALVPNARVFAKSTFSALQAEGLLEYLRRHGIYHLLLVGIEIPVCIYQTALHAVDSDLDVTVLSDCVTGRRVEDCLVTLDALTRAHCHVLPSETVYYSMLGNSTHPLFSGFNALLKRYAQPGGLDAAPPPPSPREPMHHERRPVLAAPEDQPETAVDREFVSEGSDSSEENEPYIGHSGAEEPAAGRGSRPPVDTDEVGERSLEGDEENDDDDTEESDEIESSAEDEGDDSLTEDEDEASAPAGQQRGQLAEHGGRGHGQGQGGGGEPGRRRRGRRRRGGARRRRARERREGRGPAGPGGGDQGGGGPSPSAAPSEAPRDEPGSDAGARDEPRASE